MVGFFAGDFWYEWFYSQYPPSLIAIQNRPAGRRRPGWNSIVIAKRMKHGFRESRNDAPCQHRGQTHEIQSCPCHDCRTNRIGFDDCPRRRMLEITIRGAKYSPRFSGCAAEFTCLMMDPK